MTKVVLLGTLVLTMVASASAALPVNGGFETGDLTGWTTWSSPWATAQNDTLVQNAVVAPGSTYALELKGTNASYGVVQEIPTIPGQAYTINLQWKQVGSPASFWNEVLFFNPGLSKSGGTTLYDMLDDPQDSSILAKVDGWGMNPPTTYGWKSPFDGTQWYPAGLHTNTIVATGDHMYVGLKAGTVGAYYGAVDVLFDNVVITPEPATVLLLGIPALLLRRRR